MDYRNEVGKYHTSVLYTESLASLNIIPGEVYLDATLGGSGHTAGIIENGGKVVALDIDEDSIDNAKKKFDLEEANGVWVTKSGNLKIYQKNFKDLKEVAEKENSEGFSGIIFDLGVSSFMLDTPERGFSFSKEGPLDMRMDKKLAVTASDLLNGLNEGELNELFSKLGGEHHARRIASDVVRHRIDTKITTTRQLAEIIYKVNKKGFGDKVDPATRVFMALRIAVNDELNSLKEALPEAINLLKKAGRLVVISFHSLEDKIVKDFFKQQEGLKLKTLTDKPLTAGQEELKHNPRSRSAKMRVAERI